jgi:hypothetical protein
MTTIPTITISADGTDCSSGDDFDTYVSFVSDRIDDRAGFTVNVESAPFGEGGADRISGADDAQRETIREAMQVIWQEWCAQPAVEA